MIQNLKKRKETCKQPMERKTRRGLMLYTVLVLMMTVGSTTVFATNDPIAVVNNLS